MAITVSSDPHVLPMRTYNRKPKVINASNISVITDPSTWGPLSSKIVMLGERKRPDWSVNAWIPFFLFALGA